MIEDRYKTLNLERILKTIEVRLSRDEIYLASPPTVAAFEDPITDQICFQFRASVLGVQKPFVIPISPTLGERIYKRFAPKWLQKLVPVEDRSITVNAEMLMPMFKHSILPGTGTVRFQARPWGQ